ncbi:hypothetical protein JCM6882_006079 [Rhodosporidiobolus microsporus]
MNPNDLFLRSHAHAQQQQQQQAQQAAAQAASSSSAASTSAPPPQLVNGAPPPAGQGRSAKDVEQERKDQELAQLLEMMDDYKPIIPDEVTDYYLQRAGFDTNDVRVKRLLALSAQRFISSISSDAFQYARARTAAGPGGRGAAGAAASAAAAAAAGGGAGGAAGGAGKEAKKGRQRTVLTMEDLSAALKEYGVDASRAPYYL